LHSVALGERLLLVGGERSPSGLVPRSVGEDSLARALLPALRCERLSTLLPGDRHLTRRRARRRLCCLLPSLLCHLALSQGLLLVLRERPSGRNIPRGVLDHLLAGPGLTCPRREGLRLSTLRLPDLLLSSACSRLSRGNLRLLHLITLGERALLVGSELASGRLIPRGVLNDLLPGPSLTCPCREGLRPRHASLARRARCRLSGRLRSSHLRLLHAAALL
jgi:hypothetical protein